MHLDGLSRCASVVGYGPNWSGVIGTRGPLYNWPRIQPPRAGGKGPRVFCRECGKQIEDDARFCRFCGKAQADEAPAAGTASASPGRATSGTGLQHRLIQLSAGLIDLPLHLVGLSLPLHLLVAGELAAAFLDFAFRLVFEFTHVLNTSVFSPLCAAVSASIIVQLQAFALLTIGEDLLQRS